MVNVIGYGVHVYGELAIMTVPPKTPVNPFCSAVSTLVAEYSLF